MALSAAAQRSGYPLTAYNFQVTVGGTTIGFSEVSGISLEYETTTYRHGLSFAEGELIVRHRINKYVPLTLKKGLRHGLPVLREWLAAGDARPLDISLCDEQGAPAVTWHIGTALPVKLEAPALSAAGNDAAIETLELMVNRITIEHH